MIEEVTLPVWLTLYFFQRLECHPTVVPFNMLPCPVRLGALSALTSLVPKVSATAILTWLPHRLPQMKRFRRLSAARLVQHSTDSVLPKKKEVSLAAKPPAKIMVFVVPGDNQAFWFFTILTLCSCDCILLIVLFFMHVSVLIISILLLLYSFNSLFLNQKIFTNRQFGCIKNTTTQNV